MKSSPGARISKRPAVRQEARRGDSRPGVGVRSAQGRPRSVASNHIALALRAGSRPDGEYVLAPALGHEEIDASQRASRPDGRASPRTRTQEGALRPLPPGALELIKGALASPGVPAPAYTPFEATRTAEAFGTAWLHAGPAGAASADALGARAYTVGNHIFFGAGRYSPETTAGRELIAHELAHVAQGIADRRPIVRRSPADSSVAEEEKLDDMKATLIESLYSSPESQDLSVAIAEAKSLHANFVAPMGTRTEVTAARALLKYREELQKRASQAERAPDGALLWTPFGEPVPWTAERPHTLEEIPPFQAEHVFAWVEIAGSPAGPEAGSTGQPARVEEPPFLKVQSADTSTVASVAEPSAQAQPLFTEQGELPTERAAMGGLAGGTDLAHGISALRGVSVDQMVTAVNQRLADIASDEASPSTAVAVGDGTNALDATGEIWYVANRLYIVDRTGHILTSEFFDISGITGLVPDGVYFFGKFRIASSSGRSAADALVLIHANAPGGPAVAYGDIFPGTILGDLVPLLERGQGVVASGGALAIVVSKGFGQPRASYSDFDPARLATAVRLSASHMPWAIAAELQRIVTSPADTLVDVALDLGIEAVAHLVPEVGIALEMYQALELAAWLGQTANVAGYAVSDDEIDIAAQGIAKRVAEWAVSEAISAGVSGAITRVGHMRADRGKGGAGTETRPPAAIEAHPSAAPKASTAEPVTAVPAAASAPQAAAVAGAPETTTALPPVQSRPAVAAPEPAVPRVPPAGEVTPVAAPGGAPATVAAEATAPPAAQTATAVTGPEGPAPSSVESSTLESLRDQSSSNPAAAVELRRRYEEMTIPDLVARRRAGHPEAADVLARHKGRVLTPDDYRALADEALRTGGTAPSSRSSDDVALLREMASHDPAAIVALEDFYYARLKEATLRALADGGDPLAQHALERLPNPLAPPIHPEPEFRESLKETLDAERAKHPENPRVDLPGQSSSGGTMGAAQTDIPGIGEVVLGESPLAPQVGGAPPGKYRPPSEHTSAHGHAEEDIFNALGHAIDERMQSGALKPADLDGRRVVVVVEQVPCGVCAQGLDNPGVAPGVIKSFSEDYPDLTIIITSRMSSSYLEVKGGKVVRTEPAVSVPAGARGPVK